MTDFATVARGIIHKHNPDPESRAGDKEAGIESFDTDQAFAALVAAHEADKREAVGIKASKNTYERIDRLQRRADWLKDRYEAQHDDLTYDKAEESVLRWAIQILTHLAALAGSDKPVTPTTTPLRQNTPGGRK